MNAFVLAFALSATPADYTYYPWATPPAAPDPYAVLFARVQAGETLTVDGAEIGKPAGRWRVFLSDGWPCVEEVKPRPFVQPGRSITPATNVPTADWNHPKTSGVNGSSPLATSPVGSTRTLAPMGTFGSINCSA